MTPPRALPPRSSTVVSTSVVEVPDLGADQSCSTARTEEPPRKDHRCAPATGDPIHDPSPPAAVTGHRSTASPQQHDGVDDVRGPPETVLTFPQLRRLEAGELLGRLPRARTGVMGTHGSGLGRAVGQSAHHAESGGADHAASHGRDGPGAGRCPLCRAGSDRAERRPAQFAHVGMRAEVVAATGHLPQSEGLLGRAHRGPTPVLHPGGGHPRGWGSRPGTRRCRASDAVPGRERVRRRGDTWHFAHTGRGGAAIESRIGRRGSCSLGACW